MAGETKDLGLDTQRHHESRVVLRSVRAKRQPSAKTDGTFEAHRLWWGLLQTRVRTARHALPSHLRGNVQFKIETGDGEAEWFFLAVDGERTVGADGLAQKIDTLVTTTPQKLSDLMFGGEASKGALLVAGDVDLFRNLLSLLDRQPKPQSLLHIRGQR